MCPSGTTCQSVDCYFSELALLKSNSAFWSRTKRISSLFHWKFTCSRHDIAETLLKVAINTKNQIINQSFQFMPVLDQSRHYHNWNNLFTWLIIGVASIETTKTISSVKKKTTKIRRFTCFLIKQIQSCSEVM